MNMTNKEYVVLLHGLGPGAIAMDKLYKHLNVLGYEVKNIHYPSTSYRLETLAHQVYLDIRHQCPDLSRKIHFVTYSMGGILLRLIANRYRPHNLGRVVMIAPPNKGSEVADFLQRFKIFLKLYGPAGQQLGTKQQDALNGLKQLECEVGIIAGNKTVDPWFTWFLLPGPGDGKVTIESTKIEGMKDHIIIPASHTFITRKKQTLYQVAYFLENGQFDVYREV